MNQHGEITLIFTLFVCFYFKYDYFCLLDLKHMINMFFDIFAIFYFILICFPFFVLLVILKFKLWDSDNPGILPSTPVAGSGWRLNNTTLLISIILCILLYSLTSFVKVIYPSDLHGKLVKYLGRYEAGSSIHWSVRTVKC